MCVGNIGVLLCDHSNVCSQGTILKVSGWSQRGQTPSNQGGALPNKWYILLKSKVLNIPQMHTQVSDLLSTSWA